jgi:hypothetical protein
MMKDPHLHLIRLFTSAYKLQLNRGPHTQLDGGDGLYGARDGEWPQKFAQSRHGRHLRERPCASWSRCVCKGARPSGW